VKLETIRSLIDFNDIPEPPFAPAIPQIIPVTVVQLANPTSSGDSNWASFDVGPVVKAYRDLSNVNPLERMLSQLSVPSSLPAHVFGAQGPLAGSAPAAGNFTTFPASVASFSLLRYSGCWRNHCTSSMVMKVKFWMSLGQNIIICCHLQLIKLSGYRKLDMTAA
jgi:hypothetical protein